MGKPTKSIYEQRQVDAEELEFKVVGSREFILELEDGTTIKLFFTPAKVIKLKDVYNKEGEPVYQVKWGTGIPASVPPELVRLPEETRDRGRQ